jgi:hypothetical protein
LLFSINFSFSSIFFCKIHTSRLFLILKVLYVCEISGRLVDKCRSFSGTQMVPLIRDR